MANPSTRSSPRSKEAQLLDSRKSLHTAIYGCTACRSELGKYVRRVQPRWDPKKGAGSPRRWGMIVGQAPGRTESGGGKVRAKDDDCDDGLVAFIGPGGKRLRAWLVSEGFTKQEIRSELWKTAVTKCYPGKRGRGNPEKKNHGDRVPTRAEIRACRRFLDSEIALVQPEVIITLGTVAARWFDSSVGTLDEIVGKKGTQTIDNRSVVLIRLPHPSPGSLWLNDAKNKKKLNKALALLGRARLAR